MNINIIQVYAPTADSDDNLVEEYYDQLKDLMKSIKSNVTIIMGDFNAKVGNEMKEDIVGKFELGIRKERGERLTKFYREHKFSLAVYNTFFQLPRRLYTWRSSADSPEYIVRNQIDYFIIQKSFQNAIKSLRVSSDHNPVIGKIEIKLKKVRKKSSSQKPDIRKLKNKNTRTMIVNSFSTSMTNIAALDNPMEKWNKAKQTIGNIYEKQLKPTYHKKKEWMTK